MAPADAAGDLLDLASAIADTAEVDQPPVVPDQKLLLHETWERPRPLVTNEYAHWNPNDGSRVPDATWDVYSGSLWSTDGGGSNVKSLTDPLDAGVAPLPDSSNANNSAVFRAVTHRRDFGDVAVEFEGWVDSFGSTQSTPAVAWDGLHLFLRYENQKGPLHYVSVNRRDGQVLVKKKTRGGSSNGGTYHQIGKSVEVEATGLTVYRVECYGTPMGLQFHVFVNGEEVLSVVDQGAYGTAPIQGGVGIRSDNCIWVSRRFDVEDVDLL